ncbi:MAG: response regulator, partial [Chloroflexota bacterium]
MPKILIVEDDEQMLQMLTLMVNRTGHESMAADSGKTALELVEKETPDLAIIDVMMPEMNGLEVCQKLRARPQTVELPILILTARSQQADRDAAMQAGADDYLTK